VYLSYTLRLFTTFYENGGLVAVSFVSALIIVACTQETIVKRFFSLAPLRYLGKISYGVYLLHWVLFMWVTHTSLSYSEQRLAVVVFTLVLATISNHYIETPIQRGAVSTKMLTIVGLLLASSVIAVCGSYFSIN